MSTAILAPGSRGRRLSKRLLQVVITLFGLLLLTFTIGRVMPIDPVLAIVGPDADQSTYQQVYQQLGFDKSLTTQFGIYFVNLLHGDLGNALLTGKPVVDDIIRVFPATMELCILAFGFALMVGIPVGMLAGIYRNKWQDKFISALALIGFSIPVFWLALLLTLFFSLTLGWLPVSGRFDLLYNVQTVSGFAIVDAWLSDSVWRDEMIVSALRHMVLPVLTLAVAPTTEVIRLMRISTIEVFDQNYVKAAATRGLSRLTILRRHVLHNALPPVIPRLGLQFSTMLTLAMITEMVFSWPGLGRWMINAIRQQDYAAISAGVMVIGSLVIIVNVVSDILGAMANPLKHKEWYALR